MKGPNKDEKSLIRIVVSRCEIDMVFIKTEYQKRFKEPLEDAIRVSKIVTTSYSAYYKLFLGRKLLKREKRYTFSVDMLQTIVKKVITLYLFTFNSSREICFNISGIFLKI